MTAKTMTTNNTQDSSQVLSATPNPSRFINIDRDGARLYAEVANTDGECECVPCEMAGTKRVWECNALSCTKFICHVWTIKVSGSEDGHWCSKARLKYFKDLDLN